MIMVVLVMTLKGTVLVVLTVCSLCKEPSPTGTLTGHCGSAASHVVLRDN